MMSITETLTISGIEQRAAVLPLNDVICDHPTIGSRLATSRTIVVDPLASPSCTATYDQTPLLVFWRRQFTINDLGRDSQPMMACWLQLATDRSKLNGHAGTVAVTWRLPLRMIGPDQ